MRAGALALLLVCGCARRSLDAGSLDLARADLATVELGVADDLSVTLDLAPSVDLAGVDLGPKRHLFEPCDVDEQCLSGDCLMASETRGWFDHVCGQGCGVVDQPQTATPCVEGICFTFDDDVFWCLPSCVPTNQNQDCPVDLVCCSGGENTSACVPFAPLVCFPQ